MPDQQSDQHHDDPAQGPAIAATIAEVQGLFASEAAMEEAVARLRSAGFDHADLSLPRAAPPAHQATPDRGAAPVTTEEDARQMRTLHGSMAGAVGALAAAGAVVATGGAAVAAAAAAAAAGLGLGGLAERAENAAGAAADREAQQVAAERGVLVLAVRAASAEDQARAETIMLAAGATKVAALTRSSAAIDSHRWTG